MVLTGLSRIGRDVFSNSGLVTQDLSSQEDEKMAEGYKNKTDGFWKKHLKPEVYNICRHKGFEEAIADEGAKS